MDRIINHQLNGIDIPRLDRTVKQIRKNPSISKFKFRSVTKWTTGTYCTTEIVNYKDAKDQVIPRKGILSYHSDEPEALLGTDLAPNAVEAVLHALASCLTVGLVMNASARRISISKLEMELDGDIDVERFMGISKKDRAGFKSVNVKIHVESNISMSEMRKLLSWTIDTSPVMDILLNPVPVRVNIKNH